MFCGCLKIGGGIISVRNTTKNILALYVAHRASRAQWKVCRDKNDGVRLDRSRNIA